MAKRRDIQDPNAEREAQKYENPIPSREVIIDLLMEEKGPVDFEVVAELLGLHAEQDLVALQRRLRAMERDGQVVVNRRGRYGVPDKMDLVSGRVIGHADGFGFLVPDEGGDDLFLSAKQMKALMHGDRVLARIAGIDRRGRQEGAVVKVLERAHNVVVGRFHMEHGIAFVVPDNKRITQDILIPPEGRGGASDGQIVEVELIEQPSTRSQPIGRIVEVLGDHMAPGMEIDIAIRAHDLPREWPPEVLQEIKAFGKEVEESHKAGREELRNLPLVTIDGEDARDFDDAVFCEPQGKGWRLLVAIADVSHYVKIGSALDKEAIKRGNSVYFPGRVIPMLPEVLSNGLCSLNPNVDRLCQVCEMFITASGAVRKFRFFDGVMRSAARLTYTEVAAMVVDGDRTLRDSYATVLPHLEHLHQLYTVLRKRRDQRGAIDFETTETQILFGRDKKIENIVPRARNDAHKMIEEFMILANVCAAEHLLEHKMPSVYRVHEGPGEDKLTNLREFLAELGLSLGGGDEPEPKHYAKLLSTVAGRPDAHLIQTVMLRSLSQAVYTPENEGHFGLAFDAYTHFTSPIRRYPDLLVHRALRHISATQAKKSGFSLMDMVPGAGTRKKNKMVEAYHYSTGDMVMHGEHCSMTERRADEATRDATDWLKCEYMQEKVGEVFDGIITSVTSFGAFVELKDVFVEGLVHITSFPKDYYHFDPAKHRLVGESTRRVYRLADEVRVQVMRVDLDRRRIDFELSGSVGAPLSADESAAAVDAAKPKKRRRRSSAKGRKPEAAKQAEARTDEAPAKKKRRRRR